MKISFTTTPDDVRKETAISGKDARPMFLYTDGLDLLLKRDGLFSVWLRITKFDILVTVEPSRIAPYYGPLSIVND